ncbi:MAG: hypothetical protein OA34_08170 [Sulfurospirillum sp. MES]|nr:MAG: hypothetical protein OA34_08170 [Sulfurospirillum sp. MES]
MLKKTYENKPLISVITVVYNGERHLEETIQSVINQTYDNVEYIIIDGGSTDGTLDIIKKYEDKIDYWVSEKDNGIYDAMNKGICLSFGEWINFMNVGDKFYDKNTLKSTFQKNIIYQADFIYSDTIFSNGKTFVCDIKKSRIIHQSLFYKKYLHKEFGLYVVAKGVTISDYLFFMLSKNKKWVKVNNPIAIFDLGGISSNLNHFKQKIAVDLMFNNCSRLRASLLLLIHPYYNRIKRFFQ